jgi:hypothetical protein
MSGRAHLISNLDIRILQFLQNNSSHILVYTNSQTKQHRLNKKWTYVHLTTLVKSQRDLSSKEGLGFLSTLVFFFMGCQCMNDLPQC